MYAYEALHLNSSFGYFSIYDNTTCYRLRGEQRFDDWCPYCKSRQPLWHAYQKAAQKAGATLTAVLKAGKLLSWAKD